MSRLVVTGAASGIGRALAERAAARGDEVIGLDRVPVDVTGVVSVPLDLADPAAVDAAVARIDGPVDALANVAGVPGVAPAPTVLAVNLVGTIRLTRGLLPLVADGGSVVSVASVAAHRNTLPDDDLDALADLDTADIGPWLDAHPLDGSAAYNTSKAALVRWSKHLAGWLVGRGVRVNTVSPGPVATPILEDFRTSMGEQSVDRASAMLGRHGRPDEIAAAVDFLLRPDASWVNGIDLPAEGGLYAAHAHLTRSPS